MNTVPHRVQRRSLQPSRQRGAAAIIAAFSLLLLVPVLALALNIGQLYYAQRELNKQATLAALSAVQVSSGCADDGGGLAASLAAVQSEVLSVIAANNGNNMAAAMAVMTGINGKPAVEFGRIESSSGRRIFVPAVTSSGTPATTQRSNTTAVRVNLSRPQPVPFINLYGGGGSLYASATAEQPALAAFRIGTTTLTLEEGALNQLLSALLGTNVNLTLVGFEGLADARVSIANLLLAAEASTLEDLLNLDLTAPEALAIIADALAATGDASSGAAAGLLTGLAGQAYSGGNGPIQNVFGQIFNNLGTDLGPSVSGVVGAIPFIDGLGLLTALATAAADDETIPLPLAINVPGLAEVGTFIKVIQPPQSAGPGRAGLRPNSTPYTSASSSQIVLQLRARIGVDLGLIEIANARIAIDLQGANGTAQLLNINCPSVANPNATATIQTTTSLLTATVGTFSGNASANPPQAPSSGRVVRVLGLLGAPILDITTTVGTETFGTTSTQTASGPNFPVELPPISSTENVTTVVGSLLNSNLETELLGALPLPLGNILSSLLLPITGLLDSVVLDPLLELLGIKVGEAAISVSSIEAGRPTIVTNCIPGTALCP